MQHYTNGNYAFTPNMGLQVFGASYMQPRIAIWQFGQLWVGRVGPRRGKALQWRIAYGKALQQSFVENWAYSGE